jgi:hypothetical protein
MNWILIAIAILIGIYLILVIPAGIAVWVSERKFKKSPYRTDITAIINDKWTTLQKAGETAAKEIIRKGIREAILRNGQEYSVDISGSDIGNRKYKIIISAGILKPITIGHAEQFILNCTEQANQGDGE